jgi:DNA-directed RNA polymerase subunit alpha
MPVEQLNLSVRTLNCLRRGGISTLGELISKEERELLSLRNFGHKSKVELEEKLKSMGLSLASSAEEMEEYDVYTDQEEAEV